MQKRKLSASTSDKMIKTCAEALVLIYVQATKTIITTNKIKQLC